jgi:lipopolysaccharide transport protein LptA
MADSIRKSSGTLLLTLFLSHAAMSATAPTVEGGFTWSADVLNSDFRSDTLDLSGNVRVLQGPMSIEAQAAKGRDIRSDNQRWTFEKAVLIRSPEAELQSNIATAAVVNGQISDARVEGSPARFEQRGGDSGRQVRGRAGVIEYDFDKGIVKLTNQVWFSNGKDEFRGDVVIYNVRDERVQINPGGSSNRVRGIIRPNQNKSNGKTSNSAGSGSAALVEPDFEAPIERRLATDGGGA